MQIVFTFCLLVSYACNELSCVGICNTCILLDFSLIVKTATLIFISGRCSAISSAKQEKSGSFYNLVKN